MELMYITNEFYNKYLDKLQQKEQLEKEKSIVNNIENFS